MRIILNPSTAVDKATYLLTLLQRGQDVMTDDLEVLDELMKMIPESIEGDIVVQRGDSQSSMEWVRGIRFERGLDVRPK